MRLKRYLEDLEDLEEEGMTTGNVGGLTASDCTPETNGLKKLKVQKRKKKKLKNKITPNPSFTFAN